MRAIVWFLAALISAQATGRQLTVEELRRMLSDHLSERKSDGDIARQIGDLQLTEQLTGSTVDRLAHEFSLGPKTLLALELLADSSEFLEPPSEERLKKSTPSIFVQQSIIRSAVEYVAGAKQRLPNLIATRITQSFDDGPLVVSAQGSSSQRLHLHSAGIFKREITYRNGHEVADDPNQVSTRTMRHANAPSRLSSWGEFGPLLVTVISDASKGRLIWYRWEKTAGGVAAVYEYHVPQNVSHYVVNYCCVRGPIGTDLAQPWHNAPGDSPNSYTGTPGYHGKLYLDPESGAILKLTLQTELDPSDAITRTDIAVEYNRVETGGKLYVCPVRSVAISSAKLHLENQSREIMILRINDVRFTDYHRFGSSLRILPDTPPE